MKITDALLAEHVVFHTLFDHIERSVPRLKSLGSVEAEHREILRNALLQSTVGTSLKEALLNIPSVGRDGDFSRSRQKPRNVRL